jgi:hypothetical protein
MNAPTDKQKQYRDLQKAIRHKTQSLMLEGYDRTRKTISIRVRHWQKMGWSAEKIINELNMVGGCVGDLHLIQAADLYAITSTLSTLRILSESTMKDIHHLEAQTGRKWYGRG